MKFAIRAISTAAVLSAALAGTAFAQVSVNTGVGVRTGVNTNIGADVRANAAGGVNNSAYSESPAVNANTNTRAGVQVTDPGIKGKVARTGNRVGNAVERGANATSRTAHRAMDSVDGVARRADRRIQGALPDGSARAGGSVNVQGSGNAGLITAPSQ